MTQARALASDVESERGKRTDQVEGPLSESAYALLPVADGLTAPHVLGLQRVIGNRATDVIIQRQPRQQPVFGPPASAAVPDRFLADPRRDTLRHQVTLRLATAYTDYALACEEVKREIREEIQASTEFAMVIVGIFLGPIGSAASGAFRTFLNNTPTTASRAVTRAALLALDHEEAIGEFMSNRAEGVAERMVNAVAGRDQSSDDAVINAMRTGFRETVDGIAGDYDRMTDAQLVAVWANYDPGIATQEKYHARVRAAVDQARRQRREEAERRRREEQRSREEHNRTVDQRGAQTGDYRYTSSGSVVHY